MYATHHKLFYYLLQTIITAQSGIHSYTLYLTCPNDANYLAWIQDKHCSCGIAQILDNNLSHFPYELELAWEIHFKIYHSSNHKDVLEVLQKITKLTLSSLVKEIKLYQISLKEIDILHNYLITDNPLLIKTFKRIVRKVNV